MTTALIILVFSGCALTENPKKIVREDVIGDRGFFTGQPCGPPCLWGIFPGSTTEDHVFEVLREKGIDNQCERFDSTQEGGVRGIICRGIAVFSFKEGAVEGIGYKPSKEITVEEAIKKFGEPGSVRVTASGLPEYPHTVMTLYFDNIRTNLSLPAQEGITYRVESTTLIENIGYSSDETYKPSKLPYPNGVGYGEYRQYP